MAAAAWAGGTVQPGQCPGGQGAGQSYAWLVQGRWQRQGRAGLQVKDGSSHSLCTLPGRGQALKATCWESTCPPRFVYPQQGVGLQPCWLCGSVVGTQYGRAEHSGEAQCCCPGYRDPHASCTAQMKCPLPTWQQQGGHNPMHLQQELMTQQGLRACETFWKHQLS